MWFKCGGVGEWSVKFSPVNLQVLVWKALGGGGGREGRGVKVVLEGGKLLLLPSNQLL